MAKLTPTLKPIIGEVEVSYAPYLAHTQIFIYACP